VETKATCMVLTRRLGVVVAMVMWIDFSWVGIAAAEKVRIVMPSKSMTYMNFYVGEKVGLYKAEDLDVTFEVMKPDIGVAAMVAGEIDYMTGIGSILRAAVAGVPLKAVMFTMVQLPECR